MRIGLVNDLKLAVESLRLLVEEGGHQIAWVAENGREAVSKCAADTPDLILMDLVMPVMNGAEATREIMQHSPCAILVVTASIEQNSDLVYESMGYGALDAAVTPTLGGSRAASEADALREKINRIAIILGKQDRRERAGLTPARFPAADCDSVRRPPMIAIGASTGGPQALAKVLGALPNDFPGVVGIVQHVDADFAPGLADWLSARTRLPVQLAGDGANPVPGHIYLAGKDAHLKMGCGGAFDYDPEPAALANRPSVDVFFQSLAASWPAPGVAVILTGMGRDGAEGLLALRKNGWRTIAQDRESSVVYGMPKAATENGAAEESLPIDLVGPTMIQRLTEISHE